MLKDKMQYQQNRIKLSVCIVGLILMFMVEVWGGIRMNGYLHTLWIAFFALILPYEGILYVVSFLFPLCAPLSHFAHVFLALFFILVMKKYMMQGKRNVKFVTFALIACFSFLEILAYIYYDASSLNKVLGYVSTICVLFLLLYEEEHGDYQKHLRTYILGVFMLCLLVVVNTILKDPQMFVSDIWKGTLRLGGTANTEFSETDIAINANSLAYYSVVAIACFLCLCKKSILNKKVETIFLIIQVALICITGMLTVSRSWLLVVAIIVFMFYVAVTRTSKSVNRIIALLLGILILLYVFVNSSFMDAFILRFAGERVESAGGRTELIKQYFKLYFSDIRYLIFGTGVSDYRVVLGMDESMHNATQQILVCMGFPMAMIFIAAVLRPVFKSGKKVTLQYWIPFVSIVLFVQTIQFLNPNTLMISYLIGLYAVKLGQQENKSRAELICYGK